MAKRTQLSRNWSSALAQVEGHLDSVMRLLPALAELQAEAQAARARIKGEGANAALDGIADFDLEELRKAVDAGHSLALYGEMEAAEAAVAGRADRTLRARREEALDAISRRIRAIDEQLFGDPDNPPAPAERRRLEAERAAAAAEFSRSWSPAAS
jgi:hypothetical protein